MLDFFFGWWVPVQVAKRWRFEGGGRVAGLEIYVVKL